MPEIVIIIVAVGVLLFGGKKITEIARSMGSASGEFKKAKRDVENELKAEEEKTAPKEASAADTTDHSQKQ